MRYDDEERCKFETELTCHSKVDMNYLTNFDQRTQKSQKYAL